MKYLGTMTPYQTYKIRTPIWNGGQRKVGLATSRLTKHNVIDFTYVRKSDGLKSIPDLHYFDGNKAKQYDKQTVKGVELVLIPLDDLELVRWGNEPPKTEEKPVETKEDRRYILVEGRWRKVLIVGEQLQANLFGEEVLHLEYKTKASNNYILTAREDRFRSKKPSTKEIA